MNGGKLKKLAIERFHANRITSQLLSIEYFGLNQSWGSREAQNKKKLKDTK